jgi:hypothetical protein
MPGPYEYADYLGETWGISLESGTLLLQAVPVGPGQFRLARGSTFMVDCSYSDHPIVQRLSVLRSAFPYATPLQLADEPPEGVKLEKLIWCERSDGLWGARDVQAYLDQARNEFTVKAKGDPEGPFTIAAAASNDEAKIVVVSSRDFCVDEIAFAREMTLSAEGLSLRSRNPGNLTLLVNSLHWLNDNEEMMDLGRPIDVAGLEIAEGPTRSFIGWLVWGIWPAIVVACGGAVWYVRRR